MRIPCCTAWCWPGPKCQWRNGFNGWPIFCRKSTTGQSAIAAHPAFLHSLAPVRPKNRGSTISSSAQDSSSITNSPSHFPPSSIKYAFNRGQCAGLAGGCERVCERRLLYAVAVDTTTTARQAAGVFAEAGAQSGFEKIRLHRSTEGRPPAALSNIPYPNAHCSYFKALLL